MLAEIIKRGFNKQQLIQINAYRFFLQVSHFNVISHPNSKHILKQFLNGSEQNYPISTYRRPRQSNLPRKAWELWTKTLQKNAIYKTLNKNFNSDWENSKYHFKEGQMIHEWSYSPSSQELYKHSTDNIIKNFADPSKFFYFIVNTDSKEKYSTICNNKILILKPQNDRANLLESNWTKQTTYDVSQTIKIHLKKLPALENILLTNYSERKRENPLIQYVNIQLSRVESI